MEITLLSSQSLRVKGKTGTLVVNPLSGKKIACDAALFFNRADEHAGASLEGNKIIIDGAGDYEIGGVKITGIRQGDTNSYDMVVDGIDVFVSQASAINKIKDTKEVEVAVIDADGLVSQNVIAALNANVLLFYGDKAEENIKALGKEEGNAIAKYVITRDKLPNESQIFLLE